MRDRQAYHNKLVVSANNKEPALNTEQAPDTLFLVEQSDILAFGRRAEKETVLAGGPAEPQRSYYLGNLVEGPLSFNRFQPQHLAFLAAYGLGSCSTAAAGGGYLHTITPVDSQVSANRDVPTFTAVQRLGESILKRLYTSLAVDSFNLGFRRDEWVTASATLKGTGKVQDNIVTEEVAGNSDETSVTLAANAVEGATAQARLDSAHSVAFALDSGGGWVECQRVSISDATPAVITITPPDDSGSNAGTYRVVYVPDEDTSLATGTATADPEYDYSNNQSTLTDSVATMVADEHIGRWLVMTAGTASGSIFKITDNTVTEIICAGYDLYTQGVRSADAYKIVQFGWLPINQSKVSEPPMRTNQVEVILGGDYDGASFTGGRRLRDECEAVEWAFSNSLDVAFLADSGDFAGAIDRGERSQTLKVDRRMKDAIYQALLARGSGENDDEPEYFAVRITGEGPEYETGYTFYWEVIFPKVGLMSATPSQSGGKLQESAELAVLAHETHGSVIVKVRNQVATYAA